MTSHQSALWLTRKRGPFVIGPAPVVEPGAGEIAIRTRAIAVNPFDRLIQTVGDIITSWIRYPMVVGSDVAGEVVAVGSGVSRFEVGDRVLGFAAGSERGHRVAEAAYQTRVLLQEHMTSRLPDALSFEAACVLPPGPRDSVRRAVSARLSRDASAYRPSEGDRRDLADMGRLDGRRLQRDPARGGGGL